MSSPEQQHSNGADYGPSIPPPSKPYHRPGHGSSSSNPCRCLCGCLKVFSIVIFAIAVLVVLFWLAVRPEGLKLHITDAALTQFNLNLNTPTTPITTLNYNLDYNLNVNLTIRNPNRHIGIYYDTVEPRAFYGGQRFASSTLPKFYQGTKNTTELNVVLKGQNVMEGMNEILSDYNSEKGSGVYSVHFEVYLEVRFKLRSFKTATFKPRIECDLKVPLHSNGTASGSTFETTGCGLHW